MTIRQLEKKSMTLSIQTYRMLQRRARGGSSSAAKALQPSEAAPIPHFARCPSLTVCSKKLCTLLFLSFDKQFPSRFPEFSDPLFDLTGKPSRRMNLEHHHTNSISLFTPLPLPIPGLFPLC